MNPFTINDQLSANFHINELVGTSHTDLRQQNQQEASNPLIKRNLWLLAGTLLQPIRDQFGPIRIASGYRCRDLNEKVGGAVWSQHLEGAAADIQPLKVPLPEVFHWVVAHHSLDYSQVILEEGLNRSWLHIGLPRFNRPLRQALVAELDEFRNIMIYKAYQA